MPLTVATSAPGLDWGALRPDDRTRPLPVDAVAPDAQQVMHRALAVHASVETAWRWLCQLTQAPYSYEWIDNLGRRSPRTLTPGADQVAAGDTVNTIFTVTSVEDVGDGRALTMRFHRPWFGTFAMTYLAEPTGRGASRYLVRIPVEYAPNPVARLSSYVLPAGDLVMIRKQLLTLASLASSASGET